MEERDYLDALDELDELEGISEGRAQAGLEPTSNPRWNWNIAIPLAIIAVVMAFVIVDGLQSETFFYDVDQAVAVGPDLKGQTIRIRGTVEPGSIVGEEGHVGRVFRVTENGKGMTVSFDRAMPDTFDENMEVVVHGTVSDDMVLVAEEVMVKCPSRYEGAPPTNAESDENISPQASL